MLGYVMGYNEVMSRKNENGGRQTSDFTKKNLYPLEILKAAAGWWKRYLLTGKPLILHRSG